MIPRPEDPGKVPPSHRRKDLWCADQARHRITILSAPRPGPGAAAGATVVCLTADGDDILTADPGDLALAEAAGIHVDLIPI